MPRLQVPRRCETLELVKVLCHALSRQRREEQVASARFKQSAQHVDVLPGQIPQQRLHVAEHVRWRHDAKFRELAHVTRIREAVLNAMHAIHR